LFVPHPIERKSKLVYISGHEQMLSKSGTYSNNTIKDYLMLGKEDASSNIDEN
jgi:hypothetical protein